MIPTLRNSTSLLSIVAPTSETGTYKSVGSHDRGIKAADGIQGANQMTLIRERLAWVAQVARSPKGPAHTGIAAQ